MDTAVADRGDVFEIAERLGFGGIELSVGRHDLQSSAAGSVRAARASHPLQVHALVLGDHNHGGIADDDQGVAAAAAEDVRLAIGVSAELGADVILVPFFMRGELVGQDAFDRCAAAFAALCPLAVQHGVTLCFEGLLPASTIRLLAERVASPAFGCYFDLANPLRRGLDSPTEIRVLGELVQRVHVKDMRVTPGDVRPGLGRVDFAECARALGDIGYDGWLTLETPPGPPPLIGRDLSFTRSVFPGLGRELRWPRFGAISHERDDRSWEHLVDDLRRAGLESVYVGRGLLDDCFDDPESAASRRASLEEHGIAITGIAGYRNLVSPDAAQRGANIEHLARCLELAPELGTWVVASETGTRDPDGDWTDSPENWGAEAWRLLDDALERLLPVAEQAGTILALEAHVKNVLKTQSQMLGLLERFPTQHLQVVCDPYNYLSAHLVPGEERATAELLDRFEARFVAAHLKDVAPGGAETATPELGTGVFDQRPYLEFLRDRRPDLDLVVEHLPPEHLPAVIERVETLLSE